MAIRCGDLGHVAGTIPGGFEAYARVLHPVDRGPEGTVSWAEVAAVTGRVVHPEVQWHALIGPADAWVEVDFDSTLVGGAAAAVEEVLRDPALEAVRLTGGESLRHDADHLNR